ncbi:MAG: caspase family protein [Sphaerochaetaceae bacterium]|nr:caspase family protein [Sphaerochaetaceae bacterium]
MKVVVIIVPFALISLSLLISCSLSPDSHSGNSAVYVVSVGLNYESSIITTLYGAPLDAAETAACLYSIYTDKGLQVQTNFLISGEEADLSAQGIKSVVNSISASEEDLVVFYFSGHGSVDTNGFFLAMEETEEHPYYTKLYVKDLIEDLENKGCPAVVILDSCYAGLAVEACMYFSSVEDAVQSLFDRTERSKISVLCSSASDQVSYMSSMLNEDNQIEKHSLFTLKMLKALGWVHSTSESTKIETEKGEKVVYGYQGKEVGKTSVRELYEKCLKNWASTRQIPFVNRTAVPVLLIP